MYLSVSLLHIHNSNLMTTWDNADMEFLLTRCRHSVQLWHKIPSLSRHRHSMQLCVSARLCDLVITRTVVSWGPHLWLVIPGLHRLPLNLVMHSPSPAHRDFDTTADDTLVRRIEHSRVETMVVKFVQNYTSNQIVSF